MEKPPDDPGRRGAVAIVVRNGQVLVIRRSRQVVAPLTICFPGGGIEQGESEQQALVREFYEELGVTIHPVRRLWQCVTAWKVELAWWLCDLADNAALVLNPAEVDAIYWVTPAEMAQMPGLLDSNRIFLELVERGDVRLGT
jgi:8-oxo-dGTP diphosphatase